MKKKIHLNWKKFALGNECIRNGNLSPCNDLLYITVININFCLKNLNLYIQKFKFENWNFNFSGFREMLYFWFLLLGFMSSIDAKTISCFGYVKSDIAVDLFNVQVFFC